jgi:hypothetical protein
MVAVNPRAPRIPRKASTFIGRSLSSLQGLSDVMVHLQGWRFRRVTTHQWQWFGPFDEVANDPYIQTPDASSTQRIITTIGPLAEYLHVTFVYQGKFSTGGVRVDLELKNTAGVLKAGPVTWTTQGGAGTLDENVFPIHADSELAYLPQTTAHTGTDPRVAGDAYPGLLDVPVAMRGQRAILEFTCTNVRLLSATVWEFPTLDLDP